MVKGIDVYGKFQGPIDWAAVAKDDVEDVFVKLTNGAGPAAVRGDTYVTGAHGAGLKVGGYHYALGGPSPAAQADAFAAELTRLHALDLACALDFEDASLPTDTAERRAWIVAFFTRLKIRLPGLTKALLYSNGSELTEIGADSIALPGLGVLPWDGEYGPNDGAEHPVVHYTGRRAIHQYTSEGHVQGIGPGVDLDDITGDITEGTTTMTDFDSPDAAPKPGTYGWDELHDREVIDNPDHGLVALGKMLDALPAEMKADIAAALSSASTSGTPTGTYPVTLTIAGATVTGQLVVGAKQTVAAAAAGQVTADRTPVTASPTPPATAG